MALRCAPADRVFVLSDETLCNPPFSRACICRTPETTMAQIPEQHVYLEGRCRQCGWRVVVTREDQGHSRDGRWCGPVETDHPFVVSDDPPMLSARTPFVR